MARITGIDLPGEKITKIALTKIFGIGRCNVEVILKEAGVNGLKRAKDLTDEEISKIQKAIEASFKTEGDLRKEISGNINRLKQVGSYRGRRHLANLPVRGQRTRTNARTKRGKRVTIGALKKDALAKQEQAIKTKSQEKAS